MRSENLLIIAGHAWQCLDCQAKLLANSAGAVAGHRLTEEERTALANLKRSDFITLTSLAAALQLDRHQLDEILNHPRTRLRHF